MAVLSIAGTPALADEPEPPTLIQPSPAAWPDDAGVGGDVELFLTLDATGKVTAIEVQSSPGEPFTAAAVTAAKGLVFDPVIQDGGAVGLVLAYRYRFEPPSPPPQDAGPGTARLAGRVMTKGTRDVIALAQVTLADGGQPSAETDADGRFTLEVPAGALQVEVTASGHTKRVFKEKLSGGQRLEVLYRLEPTFVRPYETVVRGQSDRAELSRVTLTGPELHEAAGTGGQPLRVVMLLPGVVTPASGLSYPVVRGSLPAATGFYLDGVRIPQLYHLMAASSVVHADLIDRIDFFPSNAPSRYGRITGGVVAAQVAKPRDDRLHATIAVDLLQSNALVELPIASTGTSISLAGSVNYAGWLLGALAAANVFDGVRPVFESYDYQARVEQKVGRGNIRLLAFGSSDLAGARDERGEGGGVTVLGTSRFHRIDLRGQYPIGPGVLEAGSWIGWETMGMTLGVSGTDSSFKLDRFLWTGRISYRVELGEHVQLKAGFDFERQVSDVENTAGIGTGDILKQPRTMGVFTGSFVEAAFFSKQWTVVAGARVDTWHLPPDLTLVSVDPRLEVRFKPLDALTLRASAGLAHQAPMLLISLPISDTAALRSGLQEVGQFSLGAVGTLPGFGLEISGEAFYNHLFQARERSLIEFLAGQSSLDDRYLGNRWGRAYGLEVMLRLPQQSRLFGWLSYTLMRSERMRRFALFTPDQTVVEDTTAMLPFAFDQTHTLNLTLGYVLPKGFRLSASVHFNTGRPESGEFSSRTSRIVSDPVTGAQQWAEVPLNQVDRLPAYARLDLRASKTITFSTFSAELYLDILNTLGIPEVYGYRYQAGSFFSPSGSLSSTHVVKEALSLPIVLPTLGVKVVY
ncbi:MAG: TonB-dependent receptor [Archangium sp.]|nr:TonB-dependent receptor [Archangium sp.]